MNKNNEKSVTRVPSPLRPPSPPGSPVSFKIREYGRRELAAAYSPGVSPGAAWRKLDGWIRRAPGLTDRLAGAGYDGRSRTFTPAQVRLIVEALGEP